MAINFPNICPQKRSITVGGYAVKRFNSYSGAGVTRLYGSKPFDSTLELSYLLPDTQVASFVSCFHSAQGGFDELTLQAEVLAGIGKDLTDQLKTYTWRWQAPPKVESVKPGLSRIRASLIGTLDI